MGPGSETWSPAAGDRSLMTAPTSLAAQASVIFRVTAGAKAASDEIRRTLKEYTVKSV